MDIHNKNILLCGSIVPDVSKQSKSRHVWTKLPGYFRRHVPRKIVPIGQFINQKICQFTHEESSDFENSTNLLSFLKSRVADGIAT